MDKQLETFTVTDAFTVTMYFFSVILSLFIWSFTYVILGSLGKLWLVMIVLIMLYSILQIYYLSTGYVDLVHFFLTGAVRMGFLVAAYFEYRGIGSLTNAARNRLSRGLNKTRTA